MNKSKGTWTDNQIYTFLIWHFTPVIFYCSIYLSLYCTAHFSPISSATFQLVLFPTLFPSWLISLLFWFSPFPRPVCPTYSGLSWTGPVEQTLLSCLSVLLVEGGHQGLEPFNILDGAPQDLNLGQPLVGVHQRAPLQSIEGLVHLL